jgi:hypothetical protein
MNKYYFIFWTENTNHKTEERTCVMSGEHPFQFIGRRRKEDASKSYIIKFFQEISEEEFDMFKLAYNPQPTDEVK